MAIKRDSSGSQSVKGTGASKVEDEDDFDPHLLRDAQFAMTNIEAKFHLIKSAFGTGCLASPLRYNNIGYLNGLILTLLTGIIVLYALHKLVRSIYVLCKRNHSSILSYTEGMEMALLEGPTFIHVFSKTAGLLVGVILPLYHLGTCSIYIVFISSTIKHVIEQEEPKWQQVDVRWYIVLMTIPLAIIFSMRNLKKVFIISIVAGLMLFVAFVILFLPICFSLPSLDERQAFRSLENFPLLYGTVVFAMPSGGRILHVEANMKTPKSFRGIFGVLNQGYVCILFLHMTLACIGSLKYGDELSGSITDNLPASLLNSIVQVVIAIAILFAYTLRGYDIVDIIWHQHMSILYSERNQVCLERIFRFIMVLASVACAISLPHFTLILPFFGALCYSILGLIFPALMDICTRYKDGYGVFKVHLITDLLIIMFGLLGGATGTYTSLKEEYMMDFNS